MGRLKTRLLPGCDPPDLGHMNIHHLELFYYVATYGGISRAVRHMPYGIQQPAVSSQILQLEEELGARLFERTPFCLRPPGEELFAAIKPFFDSLEGLPARISKANVPRLRIAAAEMVLSEYLPLILARLKKRFPHFRIGLQTTGSTDLEALFAGHHIDVAIFPLSRRPIPRLRRELLVSLPMVLLVPRSSEWKSAEELWASGAPSETLISLPPGERISWGFQDELKRRRVEWPVAIEASSLALLTRYVENEYGIGVTVLSPDLEQNRNLRVLPLKDFPSLDLYAIWQGEAGPLTAALLEEVQRYAREEWPHRGAEKSTEKRQSPKRQRPKG